MKYPTFNVSVSDVVIQDKKDIDHGLVWHMTHPMTVRLSRLKKYIETGHPFLCCNGKKNWNGQQLFCIDIDHFEYARGIYTFDEFIALLDVIGLPPCMAYTTLSNPDRKRERFRLLFQLSDPVTTIEEAWKISRFLFAVIDELVPGAPDKNCKKPYNLFYPGKKTILYRPKMSAQLDVLNEAIRESEKSYIVLKTSWAWNKMNQVLKKDPYIPSIQFGKMPPGLLLILGDNKPWILNTEVSIKTSLDTVVRLRFLNNNRISYNLINLNKIIDYYYNSGRGAEQSEHLKRNPCITVFEYYQDMLSDLLFRCSRYWNLNKEQAKILFKNHVNLIYQTMGIQVIRNRKMIVPTRLANYANAILDLSGYPNLSRLFQRDSRKQMVIASIALLAREISLKLEEPPRISKQYVITYQMIADKLARKFKKPISKDGLVEWMKQFHELHLIHVCKEEEIAVAVKQERRNGCRRPTVLQIPYFDRSVLIHAEIRAAQYKPPISRTLISNEKYMTTKTILTSLLSIYGWFSRAAFIRCIQEETVLGNTDGYTVENAKACFDKYIGQIQKELGLTKSPCTKELMVRFPGNHKIGLTRLYYRKENL